MPNQMSEKQANANHLFATASQGVLIAAGATQSPKYWPHKCRPLARQQACLSAYQVAGHQLQAATSFTENMQDAANPKVLALAPSPI